ncbi:PREDICTED: polyadenylate-binding protein 5-like isoform X2 [Camelina sativa]|uniref:Polyadenylate-binding protein 5-like isoform X2 n=1 Tax=Camelina sativa TaxID=90675 RepID=A0ABM0TBZ9_CAMSA|nr:PREDICTED: polyadenylate-binding protein 5-like isoform X2 [Camelina sativa]
MVEEQNVWGFGSHISESALFDFFDRGRTTSLASVTLHRDAMNNSLRRATLMYGYKDEAKAVSRALSELPLGLGEIHMSLESFPEEEIPARVVSNQMMTTATPLIVTGLQASVPLQSYPTYQLFPDHQSNLPRQGPPMSQITGSQGPLPLPLQSTTSHLFPDHPSNLPRQGPPMSQIKVYVGNISSTTTEDQLRMVFSAHRHVENVSIIRTDGAFIKFKDVEGATAAITHLNGFNFEGRVWHVRYWVKDRREEIRQGMEKRTICYVRNFKYDLHEAGLREMFQHCGEVSYCKIRRDPTGKSRGDGFLEFTTPEAASEAMKLDGKLIVGGRTIYVKPAKSKE